MTLTKLFAGAIATLGLVTFAQAATVDQAISKASESNAVAQKAQKQIDKIDNQIRGIERDYLDVVAESEGLNIYLQQLEKQVSFQSQELNRINSSMSAAVEMDRDINPLLVNMVSELKTFVASDLPFYKEDRLADVAVLEAMLNNSELTVAEKYRRILSAYQDEIEYGNTLEKYRGELAGQGKEVDFLRIGRLSLVYMTLDQSEMAAWDQNTASWIELDRSERNKIIHAMRVASEQTAPSLVKIPVVIPE